MAKQFIAPEGAAKGGIPLSPAIKAGNLLFVSGQVGTDPATGKLVPGGVKEQTEQVLRNIDAILKAAGATRDDVLRTNCYLTDIKEFGTFNQVYSGFFATEPRPARTTTQVGLVGEFLVEVDAVALIPE